MFLFGFFFLFFPQRYAWEALCYALMYSRKGLYRWRDDVDFVDREPRFVLRCFVVWARQSGSEHHGLFRRIGDKLIVEN